MSRDEMFEKLKDVMISCYPKRKEQVEKADWDSDLASDLGLSSIDILYLVISIEETFNIRFENVGVGDFRTINDVINYIEKNS